MEVIYSYAPRTKTHRRADLQVGRSYRLEKVDDAFEKASTYVGKVFITCSMDTPHPARADGIKAVCLEDGFLFSGYMTDARWVEVDATVNVN